MDWGMAHWDIKLVLQPQRRILVAIVGEITLEDAAYAAQRVTKLLDSSVTPAEVVIDLRGLVGYPVMARERWSELLKARRPRIVQLTWVTSKSTYRMVAWAVGLVVGIPTRVLDESEAPAATPVGETAVAPSTR